MNEALSAPGETIRILPDAAKVAGSADLVDTYGVLRQGQADSLVKLFGYLHI